jgi:hypothetical protein
MQAIFIQTGHTRKRKVSRISGKPLGSKPFFGKRKSAALEVLVLAPGFSF